jgi:hypothetical protein
LEWQLIHLTLRTHTWWEEEEEEAAAS